MVPLTAHWTCFPVTLVDSLGSLLTVFLYLFLFVQLDECVLCREQIILFSVAVVLDVPRAFTEMQNPVDAYHVSHHVF